MSKSLRGALVHRWTRCFAAAAAALAILLVLVFVVWTYLTRSEKVVAPSASTNFSKNEVKQVSTEKTMDVESVLSKISDESREQKEGRRRGAFSIDYGKIPSTVQFSPYTKKTEDWADHGAENPAACVETLFWAAKNADIEKLQDLIVLDDGAKIRLQYAFDRAPLSIQSEYPTLQKFAAFVLAASVPKTGYVLSRQQDHSSDRSLVMVMVQKGSRFRVDAHEMVRDSNGKWLRIIDAGWADRALRPFLID